MNNLMTMKRFLSDNPQLVYTIETSIKVTQDQLNDKRILFEFYLDKNPNMIDKIFDLCLNYFSLDSKQITNYINSYVSNLFLFGFDDDLVKMYFINEGDNMTFTQLKCTLPTYEILTYSYGQLDPTILGNLRIYFYLIPIIRNDGDLYFKVNPKYNIKPVIFLKIFKSENTQLRRIFFKKIRFLFDNGQPSWINYSNSNYCVYFKIDSIAIFESMLKIVVK